MLLLDTFLTSARLKSARTGFSWISVDSQEQPPCLSSLFKDSTGVTLRLIERCHLSAVSIVVGTDSTEPVIALV